MKWVKRGKKIAKDKVRNFLKDLESAVTEKDVENAYRNLLSDYLEGYLVESPYKCDGYYADLIVKVLLEVKHKKNFLERSTVCEVLIQTIYYLKRFEMDSRELPNVILVGDEDECFVVPGHHVYKYLNEQIDWSIAPSKAGKVNSELLVKLLKDDNISPYIFYLNQKCDLNEIFLLIEKYGNLAEKVNLDITEKNIHKCYEDFLRTVIGDDRSQYTPNELVSIFIQAMIDPTNCYRVHTKPNILHLVDGTEIRIKGLAFEAFFCLYNRNYSLDEKHTFSAIADRLLEDTQRRIQGAFWTPVIWVEKAYLMMDEVIGDEWRKKYYVWDASCGSLNLTRDHYFEHLFCSTLYYEDLILGRNYNTYAKKFQFDFLNDDIGVESQSTKIPQELKEALKEKKPFVFFNNPPFAQAGDSMGAKGSDKSNVAKTEMNSIMLTQEAGKASQQLYAQFLWRIMNLVEKYELEDVYIVTYSPPLFLTGGSYRTFRQSFLGVFEYVTGTLFQASNFADVRPNWGIAITIFTRKEQGNIAGKNEFEVEVCDIIENDVVSTRKKVLYNTDEVVSASSWVRKSIEKVKTTKEYLNLQSALKYRRLNGAGAYSEGALGYFLNDSNSVYANAKFVGLFTAPHAHGHGVNVMKENFKECISLFAARSLTVADWMNQKDEYLMPNLKHIEYAGWVSDALIFSIFSTKSCQSSLRSVVYKGKMYNIYNQWFFMSRKEMKELALKYRNEMVYNDVLSAEDRYVYLLIEEYKVKGLLSEEALAVLNTAKEIVKKSFEYRELMEEEATDCFVNTWDAGWYQIKLLLKQYHLVKELYEFQSCFEKLCEKMRPQVYRLGFLIK